MNDISDDEKLKLGEEAFTSFLSQFAPLDEQSMLFLEIIFEMLLKRS